MGSSCDLHARAQPPSGPTAPFAIIFGNTKGGTEEEAADTAVQDGFRNPKIPSAICHSPGGLPGGQN